jgi:hypothetical protein
VNAATPPGERTGESERRTAGGAERQAACGGQDGAGEQGRSKHDPRRQRDDRRGRAGAHQQLALARGRVRRLVRRPRALHVLGRSATVPDLVSAASNAGADAVLLTDHDTLGARRDGWEGMHDGVFLLVGTEISPKQGHYLAFGVEKELPHAGRSAGEIAAAVRAAGGIGFAAHPFSAGGQMLVPLLARRIALPHGWPALDEPDSADGLELWSLTTDAAESWRTPNEAWRWLRAPEAAVACGPPVRHLRRWDELSARRRVPAIAGLDGHAPGIRVRGRVRSSLSHARTFGLLRTHLIAERALSGDVDLDRATLIGALRAGSAWLSCPFVAPPEGARLWAEHADGTTVPMGGECRGQPAILRLRLPRAADIRVLRDGSPWHAAHGACIDLDVQRPGAYRVEARIGGRLWLLSNPVHLRSPLYRPVAVGAASTSSPSSGSPLTNSGDVVRVVDGVLGERLHDVALQGGVRRRSSFIGST